MNTFASNFFGLKTFEQERFMEATCDGSLEGIFNVD
jgi:hypothetical protein